MVKFSSRQLIRLQVSEPLSEPTIPALYSKIGAGKRAQVRARYIELQENRCYHCKGLLSLPPPAFIVCMPITWSRFPGGSHGFLASPVHLHHDHKTDLTIGAVHAYCNAVLFQYEGK